MRNDSRFKAKLIALRRRRPTGLRNFKIRVKFKLLHSPNLKLHSTVIKPRLRKLQTDSERVAAAGLEIELPKFELPGENSDWMATFANGAIHISNGFRLCPLDSD